MGRTKAFDRNEVLDSAIQLFWKKGYADTSLSDLEKATGVNKSGLYSEFKDKDDIFYESLKRYHQNSPIYDLLKVQPLGWLNVENYFKAKLNCKGQKGCFMVYTVREVAILPTKIKQLLADNTSEFMEMLLPNLKAAKVKDPEAVAKAILTFSMGMSLRASSEKAEDLSNEMMNFFKILKNQ